MAANEPGFKYAVDIVFCIDVTGSMAPVLQSVKQGALSMHGRLEAAMAMKEKYISQLRIRVIAFRDYRDKADNAMEMSPFWTMPDEAAAFERFVNGLQARDGGDEPESALEALSLAIKSDWERGLDRRRHVIVVLTDAPAHKLGTGSDAATYPPDLPKTDDQLFQMWGHRNSQQAVMEHAAKRLLIFAPDTDPWNMISADWTNSIYIPSEAGNGVAEYELDEIIESVANSL